jgi:excisionase family DNA binding protein
MEENKFLDVQNLADYIHLSKSCIYKMVSNKSIPHIKLGSRTLFERNQIDRWVINGGKMGEKLPSLPQFKNSLTYGNF